MYFFLAVLGVRRCVRPFSVLAGRAALLWCAGFSLQRLLFAEHRLQATPASVVVVHGLVAVCVTAKIFYFLCKS